MIGLGLAEIAILLIAFPAAILIALGAYKMMQLELYGLAVAASIVAMLPCHPGFVLGLPLGLGALLVLMKPEVKAAFQQRALLRQG